MMVTLNRTIIHNIFSFLFLRLNEKCLPSDSQLNRLMDRSSARVDITCLSENGFTSLTHRAAANETQIFTTLMNRFISVCLPC